MDDLPKRKQIRLKDYDYSQNGYYFVTICTKERRKILSEIRFGERNGDILQINVNGQPIIKLSPVGKIVDRCWNDINKIYPNVKTDYYVIMPDHFHGIIVINNDDIVKEIQTGGQGRPPLQKIIQGFKSVTTRKCFEYGYKQIWQRGYHEHIIRDEADYAETSEYIMNNP